MIYGYARVSSQGQQMYGNSLEAQTNALREYGATKVYCEAYTGTKMHRPELDKLLAELKPGDTLAVTKLDRVARNTRDGLALVDQLNQMGVSLYVMNMGTFDNTPIGKMMRSVMFAFAEFERDMIVQRTSEGKAIARQREDYHEGRTEEPYDEELFRELYADVKAGALSVLDAAEKLGVSRAKWYRIVKKNAA